MQVSNDRSFGRVIRREGGGGDDGSAGWKRRQREVVSQYGTVIRAVIKRVISSAALRERNPILRDLAYFTGRLKAERKLLNLLFVWKALIFFIDFKSIEYSLMDS